MTASPTVVEGSGPVRLDLSAEPPRGFLSEPLIDRLLSLVEGDRDLAAIVVESRGDTFCLGLDPGLLTADGDPAAAGKRARMALERFDRLLQAVERARCPVIAIVDGAAAGGGVGLAAAADLVIATRRATFGLPETLLGIVPALVFPVLARRVGAPRARWLALSGLTTGAAEALRLGLVDMVVANPEVALTRCLRRLARLDVRSIAAVKTLAALYGTEPAAYRAAARRAFEQLVESAETQARLRRFAAGLAPWPEDDPA